MKKKKAEIEIGDNLGCVIIILIASITLIVIASV